MEDWKDWKTRKFWIGLLALALVTAALEHLLTLSASGALKAWGRLLEIASFGSERLQNAPFAFAALNSYPLPSLILLLAALGIAGWYVAHEIGKLAGVYIAKNRIPAPAAAHAKEAGEKAIKLRSLPYLWARVGLISLIGAFLVDVSVFVPFSVISQAVAARRIFEADRDIVAPYLTSLELLQLQADFASIETKSQYVAVMQHIANVATVHHAKIHPFNF
jgi:hypothetical protein